jgi:Flp pilus assembly protein TadD
MTRWCPPSLLVVLLTASLAGCSDDLAPQTAAVAPGRGLPVAEGFAGSAACAECHGEQHDAWARSTHGRAGGPPSAETVVAPFDGTPIVFADARVVPSVEPSGAYVFTVLRAGRETLRFTVTGVIGRGHMLGGGTQGFVSDFEDGTVRFLPFDYSVTEGTWFCNTAPVAGWWIFGGGLSSLRPDDGWLPVTPDMKLTDCGDWPPVRILGTDDRFANCQSCHGSQIEVSYEESAGRYETRYTGLEINCESCHGPGRQHTQAAAQGFPGGELGLRSLATLDKDASIEVCLQCHSLKRRLEPGYLPGRDLERHFSLKAPLIGDRPYTPDGRVRTFAYQQTHFYSSCYYAGSMTCVDCHEPHGQGYRDQTGTPLSSPFDDGQCTGCHASKTTDGHTFHAPGSDGARCVSCHMPYLQQPVLGNAIPYGRSDHSISIPRPLLDAEFGITGACRQCHADRSAAQLQTDIEARWGAIKPLPPVVEALRSAELDPAPTTDAEALRLLVPGAEPIVQVAALNHLFEEYLRPGQVPPDPVVERLRALARSDDLDLSATALAALNLTAGDDLQVRAFLDESLRGPDDRANKLRARWSLVLSLVADLYRREGALDAYVSSLEAAATVTPDASETHLNLAAAYAETGRTEEAVQHYIRSVQLDPGNSVAMVNLALLLEATGREQEAEDLYLQALDVRPAESLAHMNLGNVLLRRSDYVGAIARYDQALRFTPSMPLAHLYRAVALLQLGRIDQARESLIAASEFAPADPQIRGLLAQIDSLQGR